MKRAVLVALLACTFTPGYALMGTANDDTRYSSAQLQQMIHEAHTPEQYGELADYYQVQHRMFLREAFAEEHEWAIRNMVISPVYEKWPRPVDSSRSRYESFKYQAAQAAAKAAHYSQLADQAAAH